MNTMVDVTGFRSQSPTTRVSLSPSAFTFRGEVDTMSFAVTPPDDIEFSVLKKGFAGVAMTWEGGGAEFWVDEDSTPMLEVTSGDVTFNVVVSQELSQMIFKKLPPEIAEMMQGGMRGGACHECGDAVASV